MRSTSPIEHDTVVAILECAIKKGFVQQPSNPTAVKTGELRGLSDTSLVGCIAAFRRGVHRLQTESAASFHDDLLALLDRHRFSCIVTYRNDREGIETTADAIRATDSSTTVTIQIDSRTEGE